MPVLLEIWIHKRIEGSIETLMNKWARGWPINLWKALWKNTVWMAMVWMEMEGLHGHIMVANLYMTTLTVDSWATMWMDTT